MGLFVKLFYPNANEEFTKETKIVVELTWWALVAAVIVPIILLFIEPLFPWLHKWRFGIRQFIFSVLWQLSLYILIFIARKKKHLLFFPFIPSLISSSIISLAVVLYFQYNLYLYFNFTFSILLLLFFYRRAILMEKARFELTNSLISSITNRFGLDFITQLNEVIEPSHLGIKTEYVSLIDKRKDEKEKLSHIGYLNLHRNNASLRELAYYKIPESQQDFPRDRNSSFAFAVKNFENISDECGSFAWSINMINPETWLTNSDWETKYVLPLLQHSIQKKKVDIRRIHVLRNEDYNKDDGENSFQKSINTILFREQIAGVNNKILRLHQRITKSEQEKIGITIADIFLMDFVIYDSHPTKSYFDGSKKLALCSDVVPYFADIKAPYSDTELKLYLIKDYNSFNIFKENFLTVWYFNEYLNSKSEYNAPELQNSVSDFYDLIIEGNLREETIIWDKVVHFVEKIIYPNQSYPPGKTHVEIKDDLNRELRNRFNRLVNSEEITRKNFEKIFLGYINDKSIPLGHVLY